MIKAWTFVAALHVFIIAIALLVVINTANASVIVGFDVTITGVPSLREDGSALSSGGIRRFRIFQVGSLGLDALSPDIEYSQEDEVKGVVFMSVETAEGSVDLCAMTIDTFDQISTVCSDVVSVPFKVAPPSAPGGAIFTQTVTFNITVSEN
jgi:hypothetical protein